MGGVDVPNATQEPILAQLRPFEEAEVALVRGALDRPGWIGDGEEASLRHALNLARLGRVRTPSGDEVDLWDLLAPFRAEVASTLVPALLADDAASRGRAAALAAPLGAAAWGWRAKVLRAFGDRLPAEPLDRELREKALVLVCGGGGGVSWSYLAAFDLLERHGLTPRLCAGASMGAVLLLLRARRLRWDGEDARALLGSLRYGNLFRFLQADSRYALPAAIQLQLREPLAPLLPGPAGGVATLADLPIPLLVAVTGIRTGALPHDPGFYGHLLDGSDRVDRPHALERIVARIFQAAGELTLRRDRLVPIHLGPDDATAAFDCLDAVGFSCALPGVIHYDVLRHDPRMQALLDALFERHGLARLLDGGLTDNLPAQAAREWVQRGAVGTRNALVYGLDAFAPKLRQPLWYGLEQIAAQGVARNRPYVHVHRPIQHVLSPLEVIPRAAQLERAVHAARAELQPDLPLLSRLCQRWSPPVSAG
jgi:predicted acylesterase/phospholipase RssA